MLDVIFLFGLLFIMLLFVYNGDLIKRFNKKERMRIIIILLFGFIFLILKNKDNLMNIFNKKESFSVGAPLSQRFFSPDSDVPDVTVEISDIELRNAGIEFDGDGNPVGPDRDGLSVMQRLTQMFMEKVRLESPNFDVDVNNFRFDPNRVQTRTEAGSLAFNQSALEVQNVQDMLDGIDIDTLSDVDMDRLLTNLNNIDLDGLPNDMSLQIQENISNILSRFNAMRDNPDLPEIGAQQVPGQAQQPSAANAANPNPEAPQPAQRPNNAVPANAANAPQPAQRPNNAVPANAANAPQPAQRPNNAAPANAGQELTRNISDELTDSGILPPEVADKQNIELEENMADVIKKEEGLAATKLRLNRKGKSMNSLEIHAQDHDAAAVASYTRKGFYALGTGSIAAATLVGSGLISVVEKAGNLLEKIIDKREILMRNGVLTPEMILNLSWDDLVDIIAEYFYGDMLAEGSSSIDAILSGGPDSMSTEGGNQR